MTWPHLPFASPQALWLLLATPLLLALAVAERRARLRRLMRLGELRVLSRLMPGASTPRRFLLRLLQVAAFALLVIALAGPQYGEHTELLPRKGLDVVFAVDVSTSMRARDVLPDRLERTKAELSQVLRRLGENRIGIVAFAGTAFVQCPLTTDVSAARAFLSALDPSVVPQGGTALRLGLQTALNLFEEEQKLNADVGSAGRLLVVVTDGEDHEGGVEEAAQALKKAGITTMVIGVGSEIGEPIPITDDSGRVLGYKKDRHGEIVMTRMSPQVLSLVADAAGGRFIDGTKRPDLGMSDVEAAVAGLEKRDLQARVKVDYVDRSAWPIAAALLLLLLSVLLPERPTRLRRPEGGEHR